MGARARRRVAIRKQEEKERQDKHWRMMNASTPAWLVQVQARGHQYIGGERAPAVSRTKDEKSMNARIRMARPERGRTSNGHTTVKVRSTRQGSGHPVRMSDERIVAGRTFRRTKDWNKVVPG